MLGSVRLDEHEGMIGRVGDGDALDRVSVVPTISMGV